MAHTNVHARAAIVAWVPVLSFVLACSGSDASIITSSQDSTSPEDSGASSLGAGSENTGSNGSNENGAGDKVDASAGGASDASSGAQDAAMTQDASPPTADAGGSAAAGKACIGAPSTQADCETGLVCEVFAGKGGLFCTKLCGDPGAATSPACSGGAPFSGKCTGSGWCQLQ